MSIPYPFPEYKTGRALRTSPIFTSLRDSGARFNQVMGYERPMYVVGDAVGEEEDSATSEESDDGNDEVEGRRGGVGLAALLAKPKHPGSLTVARSDTFYKPPWFEIVEQEFTASRERCSLSDFTSFAKMEVWSKEKSAVVDFLENLCSNNIDVDVGAIVYSGMQNEDGGYENDCTVMRVDDNRFLLMSPSTQQMRSFYWLKSHLPADRSVFLEDVTSLYTTLCLMGPDAKKVMSRVVDRDDRKLLDEVKPFSAFTLDIVSVPQVLTINSTPTGELGYVMYIPNECANCVYDALNKVGEDFGLMHCG